MKPRIGLTSVYDQQRISVLSFYVDAVVAGGGTPLMLPPLEKGKERPGDMLNACDALLATGGKDLDPALWGAKRHAATDPIDPRRQGADLGLIAAAWKRRMPVLGICLGCQELAVSMGGSLYQHLDDETGGAIEHRKPDAMRSLHHRVTIEPGSLLARVAGPKPLRVNTSHHQAIRDPGRGMRVVARSADGMVEAVEPAEGGRFFLGVQWHPEYLCRFPRHLALFQALCRAAVARRRGK